MNDAQTLLRPGDSHGAGPATRVAVVGAGAAGAMAAYGVMKKVIVVGTGICGLTAAYRLRQQGFEPLLLERASSIGGRTQTEVKDGYVNDLGGSLLATTYTEALQLADELGLTPKQEPFSGDLQVIVNGRFHSLDMAHPALSVLRAPYISFGGKIRLMRLGPTLLRYWGKLNLFNLSGVAALDTESAEQFCVRTVGREIHDYLLNPLTRAMYGHDCSEISVVELLWMVKMFANCSALAFEGGMGTFTSALAKGAEIRTGHEVLKVETRGDKVVVTVVTDGKAIQLDADYCVLASDGKDLQRIYGHALTRRQNHFLDELCYNPLSMVYFKLRKRPPGLGFIVQLIREQEPDVAAFAWYHLWGQTKTPPDKAVLIFLGTNDWQFRMQERPILERIADARRYALKYYPFLAELEESADVTPWARGTTVGRVGHYRRLRDFVEDIDTTSRVQYGGDYLAQSSIGTAAATGADLAARLSAAARC